MPPPPPHIHTRILQDEPTSGVDPHARHFLWDIVRGVTSSGHSVVLTTHSMAECEALCSRVGIMVNGSFQCLGTPQELKSSYGGGYKVKVRTRGGMAGPVKEFMMERLEHVVLKVRNSSHVNIACVHICKHVHMHVHVCTGTFVCSCTYTCIYTCTHIHACM